jgi:hypothetical protein
MSPQHRPSFSSEVRDFVGGSGELPYVNTLQSNSSRPALPSNLSQGSQSYNPYMTQSHMGAASGSAGFMQMSHQNQNHTQIHNHNQNQHQNQNNHKDTFLIPQHPQVGVTGPSPDSVITSSTPRSAQNNLDLSEYLDPADKVEPRLPFFHNNPASGKAGHTWAEEEILGSGRISEGEDPGKVACWNPNEN